MGYSALKKKAATITRRRSLKPDALYILYSILLSVTIIGLPIAYGIIKEYYKYLRLCLNEFDKTTDKESLTKSTLYDYKHPRNIMFEYNIKSIRGTIKAAICILLPGATFFNIPRLSKRRNDDVKIGLMQLKMYFAYIYCAEILTLFLLGLIIFSGSTLCVIICAAIIFFTAIILFKPFVVYCQAFVIYEKESQEMADNPEEYDDES